MMLQLNPTLPVVCKDHGDGEAIMIIDYGVNVNTIWVVRLPGGFIKHFYSDDIRVYDNPMNGYGWDVDTSEWENKVTKLPKGAKRNMDFLNKTDDKTI